MATAQQFAAVSHTLVWITPRTSTGWLWGARRQWKLLVEDQGRLDRTGWALDVAVYGFAALFMFGGIRRLRFDA